MADLERRKCSLPIGVKTLLDRIQVSALDHSAKY
jgi:hypothetical protein